ncbi:urethanase-like [Saccoglossus kowalevskii]
MSEVYRTHVVQAPTIADVAEIADSYGFTFEQHELMEYQEEIKSSLKMFDKLEDFVEPQLPVIYPRTPGWAPKNEENPHNAWCWRCDIKGSSDGKLAGKTIAIKDNIPIAGVPLRNGSRLFDGYTPDYDATVITKILGEGGCIIGKSTCENCCVSCGSCTSVNGPVTNPYDTTRMTGGSSTGSAVLVSVGAVDMALGTDQGGSIRSPASSCGIVGLKPTFGLVPYTGILSLESTFDNVGPMTKTVYDCALLLEVLAGYDDGVDPRQPRDLVVPEYTKQLSRDLNGIKIGVVKEGFGTSSSDKDVDDIVRQAARQFTKTGASVDEISIPMHSVGGTIRRGILLQGAVSTFSRGFNYGSKGFHPTSLFDSIHHSFKSRPNDAPVRVKQNMLAGEYLNRNYGGMIYAKCKNLAIELGKKYDASLNDYDALVMPTLTRQSPQFPQKNVSLKDLNTALHNNVSNLGGFNITGHPAITINTGNKVDGLPVGMMIVGKHFDESTVLKVAYAYEQLDK